MRNITSRIPQTVIRHTDTYVFHSYGISEGKGSVAQLVVRQIPALKVASSILAWATHFLLTKYSYKTFYMTNHPCVFKLFFWRPSPAHPLTVCPYKSLFVFLRTGAVQPARTEDGGLLAAPSSGRRARLNTRGGACAPRMASRVRARYARGASWFFFCPPLLCDS